jgi:hypothetical protein
VLHYVSFGVALLSLTWKPNESSSLSHLLPPLILTTNRQNKCSNKIKRLCSRSLVVLSGSLAGTWRGATLGSPVWQCYSTRSLQTLEGESLLKTFWSSRLLRHFNPGDRSSMFLRSLSAYLLVHATLKAEMRMPTSSSCREPQILYSFWNVSSAVPCEISPFLAY